MENNFATLAGRLILSLLLFLCAGCQRAGDPLLEERFDRVCAVEPGAEIAIRNRDGAVLVYGSNASQVQIHVTLKAYRPDRLKQFAINVSGQAGAVSIDATFPPQPRWGLFDRSGAAYLTVIVPATAKISRLSLHAGEIVLEGLRGRQTRAELGDGRIFVHNCFSNLGLRLRRGTLTLSYDWWEKEKFLAQASITQGNAWAFFPTDSAFRLIARTARGTVKSDFENDPREARRTGPGMQIESLVNGGGQAQIQVSASRGNIAIVEANP